MGGPKKKSTSKGLSKGHLRKAREDQFVYQCEWLTCTETVDTMNEFNHHVDKHRRGYTRCSESDQENDLFLFYCQWRDCGASIEGTVEDFSRHVFYHTFHHHLKHLGAHVQAVEKLMPCTLGILSRNVIPELPERLICRWDNCCTAYDNPYIFYGHVSYHCEDFPRGNHPNQPIKCLWEGCTAVAKSCHRMREHMRSHTQAKMVACPTCGALFSNNTKFIDHLKRQASVYELTYECPHCHRRFPSERILRDHMRHHVNHYKCPICDMTCYAPSALREHIQYRHSHERHYSCHKCTHYAKRESDLRKHLAAHVLEEARMSHQCLRPDCGQKFDSVSELRYHNTVAHPVSKLYKCHVCDKCFIRGTYLTQHLGLIHKYRWPSGHRRFRYKVHSDGYRRLQTTRYESIEVSEQVLGHKLTTATCRGVQGQDTGDTVIMTVDRSQTRAAVGTSDDNHEGIDEEQPLDLSCHASRLPGNSRAKADSTASSFDGFRKERSVAVTAASSSRAGDYPAAASHHPRGRNNLQGTGSGDSPGKTEPASSEMASSLNEMQPSGLSEGNDVRGVNERRGRKRKGSCSKGQGGKSQKWKTAKESNTRAAGGASSQDEKDPTRKKSCMKRKARDSGACKGRPGVKRVGFDHLATHAVPSRLLGAGLLDEDSSNSSTLYTMYDEGNGDSLSAAADLIDRALEESSQTRSSSGQISPKRSGAGSWKELQSPTRYKLFKPPDHLKDHPHSRYTLRSLAEEATSSPTRYALKTPDSETDRFSDGVALSEAGQSPTRYTLNLPDEAEPSSPTLYALKSPWREDCPSPTLYTLKSPLEDGAQSPTRYKLNDPSDDERAQSPTLYTLAVVKEEPSFDESQASLNTLMSPDDEEDVQSKYALDSSLEESGQSPTRYTLASVNSLFDENAQSPTKYQLQHSLNESVQSSTRYALKTPSQESEGTCDLQSSFTAIEGEMSPTTSAFRLKSPLKEETLRSALVKQEGLVSECQTNPQYVVVVKQENEVTTVNWSVPSPKFLSHLDPSVFQTEQKWSLEATSPVDFEQVPASPFGRGLPQVVIGPRTSSPLPKSKPNETCCVKNPIIIADERSQSMGLLSWSPLVDDNGCLKMPPTPGKNLSTSPSKFSPVKNLGLPSDSSSSVGWPESAATDPFMSVACGPEHARHGRSRKSKAHPKKSPTPMISDVYSLVETAGDGTSLLEGKGKKASLPAEDNSKDETYNLEMLGEVALLTHAGTREQL